MKEVMIFLLPLAIVILLAMPLIPVIRGRKSGKKAKHAIFANLGVFGAVCLAMIALPLTGFAAETTAEVANAAAGWGYIGAALSTGLASLGAGIAVAAAVPAAIGLYSEDPKSFGKGLIYVAMGEGIALYGILISILIINSI